MGEQVGLKTKFQRETAVPGTYEDIAQLAGVTPPQSERDVAEVEDLNPTDGIKKKLPGPIDAGEVALTLNFDAANAGHDTLQDDFYAGTEHNYRIVLPDGYTWTVKGFVSGFAPSEIAAGDVIQAEVTITVTEKPVLAAGA
ncbi:MAG TPA: phage tail tube protein [Symbiobacteriaceae bacterium]|nr:phage tail tube protein [Symbiobacteriaceae bacterium]